MSLFSGLSCRASDVRNPAVAGQFYPADAGELSETVDRFLGAVPAQNVSGTPVAILVPHAGYIFSGQTAAYAYKTISGKNIYNVVLIGNSHHFPLNTAAIYASGRFKTPLGEVEINKELAGKILANTKLAQDSTFPHNPEHSIEVQLPFLQRTLTNFKIVPILLGELSIEQCGELGSAIAKSINEMGLSQNTIIIASSDMSHYPSWANANMVDGAALKALEKFDPPVLKKTITNYLTSSIPNLSCVLCGEESVYTAMSAAKSLGANRVKVLKYTNSGETSGDKSRVVGYGAVVFLKSEARKRPVQTAEQKSETEVRKMKEFTVTEKNQKELLKIARQSIEGFLKTGKMPKFDVKDPELCAPSAVFVTLTKNKDLRGCIGTTAPQAPLYEAVSRMAVAAAFEDHRFSAVTPEELKDLHIEISVLSPMTRVKSADEIKQGTHGVVVRRGYRSGLFLPQVWEHFSKKDDFLNELCWQKAGLEPGAWKNPDTELYVFTVFAFEEH